MGSEFMLKACPFCGCSEALHLRNTHTPSFWVECDEEGGGCGTQAHGEYVRGRAVRRRFRYDPEARADDHFSARTLNQLPKNYRLAAESAIAAWNRRAPGAELAKGDTDGN